MANDLISRSALLKAWDALDETQEPNLLVDAMIKATQDAPAVDAEPVRHGRWMPYYEPVEVFVNEMLDTEIIDTQTGWTCSECGKFGYGGTLEEMPYCHCGAKMMDGDTNAAD